MVSVADRIADALEAADQIARILEQSTGNSFVQNPLLISAAKYQFIVLAEALNAAARGRSEIAEAIVELPSIIAFRNVLVHGYRIVDVEEVHAIARDNLPQLREILAALQVRLNAP